MKAGQEIRVGIVVVVALALMLGGYFALRGVGWGAQQYYLRLNGAALIAEGNDVRLQGVKVGVVQSVTLDQATQQPLLTIAVKQNDPQFSLYPSYKYSVRPSGIIGENYVDIQGQPQSGDIAYKANDRSQVIPASANAGLLGAGDKVAQDVQATLKNLNVTLDRINKGVLSYDNQIKLAKALDGVAKLTTEASKTFGPGGAKIRFGDPQAQRALNATFVNAAIAANEAAMTARDVRKLTAAAGGVLRQTGGVMEQAGGVIGDNRKQLNSLLTNLDRTVTNAAGTIESVNFILKNSDLENSTKEISGSLTRAAKNVEDTTAAFKGLGNEKTQEDLRATVSALRASTEALRDTTASVKKLLADDTSQGELKGTMTALNTTANTLAETTANLRDATAGIKNVLGDQKVQDDFKAIPAELRRTLEATTSTAERINGLLGGRRRNREVQQGSGGEESAGSSQRTGSLMSGFDFTARHLSEGRDKNFGDLRFQTELFGGPFRVGLDEIGEGTNFTLQTGKYLGENAALRYGLYRSKLGIGAEYRTGRFSLEGNLYDPNEKSWNVYGGLQLSRSLELLIGREKRGDVRSNAIGVRLRP